jgi:hypothetical protein
LRSFLWAFLFSSFWKSKRCGLCRQKQNVEDSAFAELTAHVGSEAWFSWVKATMSCLHSFSYHEINWLIMHTCVLVSFMQYFSHTWYLGTQDSKQYIASCASV